ncbi:hypothetical protein [Halobacterium bonnevillei]|uniref:Rubrerythrin-like domain-containing protein n=1 Tax=Halobacterium bonnevillei TaxID=2692200 RepID=A0A6B0SLT6_9EURY|nr:hypothetical protein [Halobacterium bonnevillei]MXR22217.1 hypothetical protein [Halobacterium bonnevillei]
MMYECAECQHMARLPGCETNRTTRECPVCGDVTAWRVAFENEGVSD